MLFVAACSGADGQTPESAAGVATSETTAALIDDSPLVEPSPDEPAPVLPSDLIAQAVASMSVEQKIGQLLMPALFGTGSEVTDSERRLNLAAHGYGTPEEIVEAYKLGGVIYLETNIDSAPQLKSFSNRLQEISLSSTGFGLLISIDQEGGKVSRISDEVTSVPPASDLAGNARLVRESSFVTGQQVQQQGINVVLAPVADVVEPGQTAFIGNRSFGADPNVVASMVVAAVEGLQQSGVAAAVKHWPGHGATAVDSHSRLPTVNVDRALWDSRERVPFEAAIDEDVAIVMVGHLAMPQLDPSALPATISPTLVNELLRGELGFDGVVMSDALNMGAVAGIAANDLAVSAVLAGVDIILIPPSLIDAAASLNAAVADGRLSVERLDAAASRVLQLKYDLGLFPVE